MTFLSFSLSMILHSIVTTMFVHAEDLGSIASHDVIGDTPGSSSAGSMPLGNGELGINLWVEKDGDLLLDPGRNDSFSAISQFAR